MALDTIYDILKSRAPGNLGISAGSYSGLTVETVFGINSSITQTLSDIWPSGGVRAPLQAATTMEIVSSSADDTSAGTGARKVTIYGLNGSWASTTEVVTLNGTTAVSTSTTFIRINRISVTEVGTYAGNNLGAITCRVVSGGATQATIALDATFGGLGTSQLSHYSVPAGKTAYITGYVIDVEASKPVRLFGVIDTGMDDVSSPFIQQKQAPIVFESVVQHLDQQFALPIRVPEKSDLVMQAYAMGATTGFVSITYQLLIADN